MPLMISPLSFLTTKEELRELLRGCCQPSDLEPLLEWAWPVMSSYKLLEQTLSGAMTVGFDPDYDDPVLTKK